MHLRREHNIDPEDVAELICTASPEQYRRNFEPEDVRYAPPSGYAAIGSIPYMVAAALVEGQLTEAELSDEKVKDPRILRAIRKVSRVADSKYKDYVDAGVAIKMKDGRTFQRTQNAVIGTPALPAPRKMIEDKFLTMARKFISKKRAQEIIDTVAEIEKLDRISDLMILLRAR